MFILLTNGRAAFGQAKRTFRKGSGLRISWKRPLPWKKNAGRTVIKKGTYTVKLTLRLPSNILHAEKSDDDLLHAIDAATSALESEVKSLKAELQRDFRWKRPAWRARMHREALVFGEPMEAGTGPQTHRRPGS